MKPFDIDENKLKSIQKSKSKFSIFFEKKYFLFGDFISNLFKLTGVIVLWLIGIGLTIFIVGSIFGILKFGWNQL